MNKNAQNRNRSLMSGLKTCDHDLLYPATVRPSCTAVNQIHEFECQDSTQEMQTMTEVIQIFQDNIKCGPEYECFPVINYGIAHLSESVKQTNILNAPKHCLMHVQLLLLV